MADEQVTIPEPTGASPIRVTLERTAAGGPVSIHVAYDPPQGAPREGVCLLSELSAADRAALVQGITAAVELIRRRPRDQGGMGFPP